MQSRFRSRHKAGFGAAGLGTAQSWFWSRHKASFYIYFLYVYFIYIYYIYIRYMYVYIYIHLYTHNQSLVLDTKHVLYWPVLEQIQFCSFDRRCKTCLETKQVLYQGRFCNLTQHKAGLGAGTKPVLEQAQSQFWSGIKTSLVSRQVLHLLSKLQNWISSKTGQCKTCISSNTKIDCIYIYIYITYIFFIYILYI